MPPGGRGAAIVIGNQNGLMTIANCTFRDNWTRSGVGGAIAFFFANYDVDITDCHFLSNGVVVGDGGAVYLDKDNSRVLLRDCVFWANTAPVGTGGALYLHSHNLGCVLERVTFVNNSAGENGGALALVTDNFGSEIRDCTFSNNSAKESGEIGCFASWLVCFVLIDVVAGYLCCVSFCNCGCSVLSRFIYLYVCMCVYAGGALHSALSNSYLQVEGCSFAFNAAGDYGGAMYFGEQHSSITLANTTVDHNRASLAGGMCLRLGDVLSSSPLSSTSAVSVPFAPSFLAPFFPFLPAHCHRHDVAAYCTVFWSHLVSQCSSTGSLLSHPLLHPLHISDLWSCCATHTGIFIFWLNIFVSIMDCIVSSNFAWQSVGGIMTTGDEFQLLRSTIVGNRALGDYGGVFVQFADRVVVRDSLFVDNTAEGALLDVFVDVDLYGSGGLAVAESANVEIDSCVISGNRAYHYGGGLFVTYSLHVIVSNTSLLNNSASSGGGMNLYRSYDVLLSSMLIKGNEAKFNGGGLLVDQVDGLVVTTSSLWRNVAETGSGSAIWLLKSTANISWSTFSHNSAPLG